MRMWMARPSIMCRQHLIGEYRELFTFIGYLRTKRRIDGYIKNDCLEPLSLQKRYDELRNEMIRRGYKPKKEFVIDNGLLDYLPEHYINHKINKEVSFNKLIGRCLECNMRWSKNEM